MQQRPVACLTGLALGFDVFNVEVSCYKPVISTTINSNTRLGESTTLLPNDMRFDDASSLYLDSYFSASTLFLLFPTRHSLSATLAFQHDHHFHEPLGCQVARSPLPNRMPPTPGRTCPKSPGPRRPSVRKSGGPPPAWRTGPEGWRPNPTGAPSPSRPPRSLCTRTERPFLAGPATKKGRT